MINLSLDPLVVRSAKTDDMNRPLCSLGGAALNLAKQSIRLIAHRFDRSDDSLLLRNNATKAIIINILACHLS